MGYSQYYRTWNVPVYDFLYSYVYQELFQVRCSLLTPLYMYLLENLPTKAKFKATLCTYPLKNLPTKADFKANPPPPIHFQWMPYRPLAALSIFAVSSFFHDFFTGVSMGFFAPVFLILFATVGGECKVQNTECSNRSWSKQQ